MSRLIDRLRLRAESEEMSQGAMTPLAYDLCEAAKVIEDLEAQLNEILKAKHDGRLLVLPCKVGDTVWVDARTLPYHYLHPADGCGDFARCKVVSIVNTGQGTYLKLRALYPSRASRRDYLRYRVGAIGKTVFLTREDAERALEGGTDNG